MEGYRRKALIVTALLVVALIVGTLLGRVRPVAFSLAAENGNNLLENGDFEGGHFNQDGVPEIAVPEGWDGLWWAAGLNEAGQSLGRPETIVIPRRVPFLDPPRIYSGQQAYKIFTYGRAHRAALYQVVEGLEPGERVRGWAWVHSWVGQDPLDPCCSTGDPWGMALRVGIDPTGGTDPEAATVVWSDPAYHRDTFHVVLVETEALSDRVTLFLGSAAKWGVTHNDVYWDAARLEVVEDLPEPTVTPAPTPTGEPGGWRTIELRTHDGQLQLRFTEAE
jgi:hypothetical protein